MTTKVCKVRSRSFSTYKTIFIVHILSLLLLANIYPNPRLKNEKDAGGKIKVIEGRPAGVIFGIAREIYKEKISIVKVTIIQIGEENVTIEATPTKDGWKAVVRGLP